MSGRRIFRESVNLPAVMPNWSHMLIGRDKCCQPGLQRPGDGRHSVGESPWHPARGVLHGSASRRRLGAPCSLRRLHCPNPRDRRGDGSPSAIILCLKAQNRLRTAAFANGKVRTVRHGFRLRTLLGMQSSHFGCGEMMAQLNWPIRLHVHEVLFHSCFYPPTGVCWLRDRCCWSGTGGG